uniref:G-protein coupled receptor 54-like n=1 Tax=Saccoglossus kowalevskii TaxID=10224 RepID=A0ABM0GRM4_SACKO
MEVNGTKAQDNGATGSFFNVTINQMYLLLNITVEDNITDYENITYGDPPVFIETWLMPVIFALIFLIGVTGNFLVIFVILKHKRMRTTTNFYILSLAVSDFAFLFFCVPFTATTHATHWLAGNFMCKFTFYLMSVTVQATCITLTAMMVDRYYAIAHPLKSLKTRTPKVAVMVSAGVWTVALLSSIPVARYRSVVYHDWYGIRPFCMETWPSPVWDIGWYVYMIIAAYLAPLLIISVCMGMIMRLVWNSSLLFSTTQSKRQQARQRQKIRKTRMVCVVIFIFAICWLPVHIMNIWTRVDKHYPDNMVAYGFQLFGNCISYANSCVNPIIYAFMSDNFRRRFQEVFSCCRRKTQKKILNRERGTVIITMNNGKNSSYRGRRQHRYTPNHTNVTICESSINHNCASDSDDSLSSPDIKRTHKHVLRSPRAGVQAQ